MANALYGLGRNKFARGEINWLATGDDIRVILIDIDDYTLAIDTHEFLTSIPGAARVAIAQMTLLDPVLGVCDAADVTFPAVTGDPSEALIIYKHEASEEASPLIAFIDTVASGLPVTPNGGDINVIWDDGANKIFKL